MGETTIPARARLAGSESAQIQTGFYLKKKPGTKAGRRLEESQLIDRVEHAQCRRSLYRGLEQIGHRCARSDWRFDNGDVSISRLLRRKHNVFSDLALPGPRRR